MISPARLTRALIPRTYGAVRREARAPPMIAFAQRVVARLIGCTRPQLRPTRADAAEDLDVRISRVPREPPADAVPTPREYVQTELRMDCVVRSG